MTTERDVAFKLPVGGVDAWAVVATRFSLDGGAMFGVVPRVVWQKSWTPDALHRVPLAARSVIVRKRERGILAVVDTGLGRRWSERDRERYAIHDDDGLRAALASLGHTPADVTDVVLTHLHWDHAGGVREPDGTLAFPNATHHVARTCLYDVARASPKDRASFRADDVDALVHSGKLRAHARYGRWIPHVRTSRSDGHAVGLAVAWIGDGPHAVLPADLVPALPHVRPAWVMAYDNAPRKSAEEKEALLGELATGSDVLVFTHDPTHAAARISRDGDGFHALPL